MANLFVRAQAGLLTALALFLTSAPQALQLVLPDFITIDGFRVSHADGAAALRSGHAVLVGDLLVGTFASTATSSYPLAAAE